MGGVQEGWLVCRVVFVDDDEDDTDDGYDNTSGSHTPPLPRGNCLSKAPRAFVIEGTREADTALCQHGYNCERTRVRPRMQGKKERS